MTDTDRVTDETPARPYRNPHIAQRSDVATPAVVYSTGAVAKLCGLSQQTVIRAFDRGEVAGYKVPGSKFRRITRAGLIDFMQRLGLPVPDEVRGVEGAGTT